MSRIMIADDHAIVREGLKLLLNNNEELQIVASVATGEELIQKLRETNCDLVILDITMSGKDVLDTIKDIKSMKPHLPILIFTMNPADQYAVRVLKAGAFGYINKESDPDEILAAIRKVLSGNMYIPQDIAELLANNLKGETGVVLHETLTNREFQIMCMIAEGRSVTHISEKLFLSKNTISNHRSHILQKLKLKNNSELTHYAIKNNLIS